MAQPPHTMQLAGLADWALMIAIHDALRRDLDQLLYATSSHPSARARWGAFRSHLRFHLAAEHAAMWPRVRPKLAGDSHGQVLSAALSAHGSAAVLVDELATLGVAESKGRLSWVWSLPVGPD